MTTTTNLLRLSLSSHPKLSLHRPPHLTLRPNLRRKCLSPPLIFAKAVDFKPPPPQLQQQNLSTDSILLDVTGMMCGACVSRVKSILVSDLRVDSAVVNMLTETAAIKLKSEGYAADDVAEEVARKLTECGFPAKRRAAGAGVEEKVKRWRESVKKKEAMLVESRNRVVFAWTLVALCCGSHATHILHSLGIHVAHGIHSISIDKISIA